MQPQPDALDARHRSVGTASRGNRGRRNRCSRGGRRVVRSRSAAGTGLTAKARGLSRDRRSARSRRRSVGTTASLVNRAHARRRLGRHRRSARTSRDAPEGSGHHHQKLRANLVIHPLWTSSDHGLSSPSLVAVNPGAKRCYEALTVQASGGPRERRRAPPTRAARRARRGCDRGPSRGSGGAGRARRRSPPRGPRHPLR